MSKESFSDFATWFYRGIIGMALSVIFFFVKSNYDDFRTMKTDIVNTKQESAVQKETNKDFARRISKIEARFK